MVNAITNLEGVDRPVQSRRTQHYFDVRLNRMVEVPQDMIVKSEINCQEYGGSGFRTSVMLLAANSISNN